MSFKTIETQDQLDAIISERLSRAKEKYEGYTSPEDVQKLKETYDKQINELNASMTAQSDKYKDFENQLAERDSKLKAYETASVKTRIAHEVGLPYEMSTRLSGETEEEIRADAKSLVSLIGNRAPVAPLADHDEPAGSDEDATYRIMLRDLRGE